MSTPDDPLPDAGGKRVRIGLIADTHLPSTIRELWLEARAALAGCDLILHAGDLVTVAVLDTLEEIAPTLAARGNGDGRVIDPRIKDLQLIDVAGWRIAMTHDLEPEDRPLEYLTKWCLDGERADILISGHTHYERVGYNEGVLMINPGSPTHPHQWTTRLGTVGILELTEGELTARVIRLGETSGLRNPASELWTELRAGESVGTPGRPGECAPGAVHGSAPATPIRTSYMR